MQLMGLQNLLVNGLWRHTRGKSLWLCPTPSDKFSLFSPCDVVKKYHLLFLIKSSLCIIRFVKFLHFTLCRRNITEITYGFNKRYFVFMHNFLCQNVLIFPLYIFLTKIIDTFWSEGIGRFWPGGIEKVWHRKSKTKNQQYSQRFELYQLFMDTFLCQTVSKSPFYILPKLLIIWLI